MNSLMCKQKYFSSRLKIYVLTILQTQVSNKFDFFPKSILMGTIGRTEKSILQMYSQLG